LVRYSKINTISANFEGRVIEKNDCTLKERYTGSKVEMMLSKVWTERKQEFVGHVMLSLS
jgi:hypothetical protein